MYIYFYLLIILLIISIRGVNNVATLIVMFAMAVVLGFRSDNVGADTLPYIGYYEYVTSLTEGHMEKGWNVMCVVGNKLGFSPYGFNFIIALLTLTPYYLVAISFKDRKLSGYILFLLYSLGFYLLMFNGMRQFMAMSLVLCGYKCLEKNKIHYFFILVFLATAIHVSSLLAIALLPMLKIKFNTTRVLIVFLLTFIAGIFLGKTFFMSVAGKYAHDVESFGLRNSMTYTFVVGLLTNLFTLFLYIKTPSLQNNFWIKCNVVSVIVLNLLSNLVIGPRIVYIFSITSVFALSLYMKYSNKTNINLIYLYAIVTFSRFIVPEILAYGNVGSLVPYSITFQLFR